MLIKMTKEQLDAHAQKAIEDHVKGLSSTGMSFIGGTQSKAVKGYDLETNNGRALAWARSLRALGLANGNFDEAAKIAQKWLEMRRFESDEAVVAVLKSNALNPSTLAEGGIFVTPDQYSDLIMLLTAKTVVRKMAGIDFQPMVSGVLDVDIEATRPTAEWVGENQEQNATEPTYSQHRMVAKTLMATSAVKNNLLDRQDAGTNIDKKILESMQAAIANAEDLAFLTGLGATPYAPTGIMGYTNAANVFASTGTSTQQVKADMSNLVDNVEGNNVQIENGNYIMNNHNRSFLGDVATTTDFPVFPHVNDTNPTLKGHALHVTSAMPVANILFVDSSKIIIGDTKNVEVTASREASYMRGSVLVSAFSRRETVFQVQMQTDLFLKYGYAASYMTGTSY